MKYDKVETPMNQSIYIDWKDSKDAQQTLPAGACLDFIPTLSAQSSQSPIKPSFTDSIALPLSTNMKVAIMRTKIVSFICAAGAGNLTELKSLKGPSKDDKVFVDVSYLIDCFQGPKTSSKSEKFEPIWPKKISLAALHVAAYNGRLAAVEYITRQSDCDIEVRNSVNQTPLLLAAYKGRHEIVQYLLQKSVNPLIVCQSGYNLLHYALMSKDIKTVKICLQSKAHSLINTPDKNGVTPIHLLAHFLEDNDNTLELAKLFIAKGADLTKIIPMTKMTAFDFAKGSKPKLAELLRQQGSSSQNNNNPREQLIENLQNFLQQNFPETLVHIREINDILKNAKPYNNLVTYLTQNKSAENSEYNQSLFGAIKSALWSYSKDNESPSKEKVSRLVVSVKEAVAKYPPKTFQEKIYLAVILALQAENPYNSLNLSIKNFRMDKQNYRNNVKLFQQLTEHLTSYYQDAHPAKSDTFYIRTELTIVRNRFVFKPTPSLLTFTRQADFDKAKQHSELIKLVVSAASGDHNKVKQILSAAEFDTSQCIVANTDKKLNITNCANGRWPDEIQLTAMHAAILNDDFEMIRLLAENGFNINAVDGENKTPLILASYQNKNNIAKYLLERGANTNIIGRSNMTLLHFCAIAGNLEMTQLCFEKGAKNIINAQSLEQQTALHKAVLSGNEDLVEFLLEKGADPNLLDSNNMSAIHFAIASAKTENQGIRMCDLLIQNGANPLVTLYAKHRISLRLIPSFFAEKLRKFGLSNYLKGEESKVAKESASKLVMKK